MVEALYSLREECIKWPSCQQRREDSLRVQEETDAATRLLMDNEFVQPFQLQVDAKQQDQWTTFVEYLAFECYWLGRRARSAQKLRLQHEAMWEEPVKADVVRPLDDLASSEVEAMRRRELERAARAVRSFTAATNTTATGRAEETLTQMTKQPRKRGRGGHKPPSHTQKSLQPAQTPLRQVEISLTDTTAMRRNTGQSRQRQTTSNAESSGFGLR